MLRISYKAASKALQEMRSKSNVKLDICKQCPHAQIGTFVKCMQCGCNMNLKTLSGAKCPIGKW